MYLRMQCGRTLCSCVYVVLTSLVSVQNKHLGQFNGNHVVERLMKCY